LRLGLVALYLARIQPQRARPDLRAKLERYQEQAADVLYAALLGEFGIIEPGRSQSEYGLTSAEQNYQQAQLLANVARQQLAIEREVGDLQEQVTGQQVILDLYDERSDFLQPSLFQLIFFFHLFNDCWDRETPVKLAYLYLDVQAH